MDRITEYVTTLIVVSLAIVSTTLYTFFCKEYLCMDGISILQSPPLQVMILIYLASLACIVVKNYHTIKVIAAAAFLANLAVLILLISNLSICRKSISLVPIVILKSIFGFTVAALIIFIMLITNYKCNRHNEDLEGRSA